jgi:activator of HSP90 ATPase
VNRGGGETIDLRPKITAEVRETYDPQLFKGNNIMKDFKKYFEIHAEPKDVYNALTNKVMIEIWTGETAEMEEVPDTEFSMWDGSITGKNIEFVKDRMIVQEWYFGDQEEPSLVTIKLHPHKNGTSMEVRHVNIPDEAYENIAEGWSEDYFLALNQLFEK